LIFSVGVSSAPTSILAVGQREPLDLLVASQLVVGFLDDRLGPLADRLGLDDLGPRAGVDGGALQGPVRQGGCEAAYRDVDAPGKPGL
jgi:hypothetical protein